MPINLCHYLFIKGDRMEVNSEQYRLTQKTGLEQQRHVKS
jgi:hypothetical protein